MQRTSARGDADRTPIVRGGKKTEVKPIYIEVTVSIGTSTVQPYQTMNMHK